MPGRFYIEGKRARIDLQGEGSEIAGWQAAESELVSIGAEGQRYKILDLTVGLQNLTGNVITIRLYKIVNGVELCCYEQTFDPNTEPPAVPVVCGTWGIRNVLKVTVESNNAADNGQTVSYDYMMEPG